MSDKIKGSDGIERSISEWKDLVWEMASLSDGDQPVDVLLSNVGSMANAVFRDFPVEIYGDSVDQFSKYAGEWLKHALLEAHDKAHTYKGKMEHLKSSIEKLSRSISKEGYKKKQRALLGFEILDYIIEHGDLPRNRNTLLEFIESRGEKMSLTSLKDNLLWYKLDKICLTYHID